MDGSMLSLLIYTGDVKNSGMMTNEMFDGKCHVFDKHICCIYIKLLTYLSSILVACIKQLARVI